MIYHIFWVILLPEFIKNIITYTIIKSKYKAYKSLLGNCCIDFKDLWNSRLILGEGTYIGEEVRLNGNINIGKYTYIAGSGGEINGSEKTPVNIGSYCSVAKNVFIIAYNFHNKNKLTTSTSLHGIEYENLGQTVEIGNDVWIGANSTILPGVSIGNGVIIGAGSVITKNIPAYSIAVGNPCKVIKYRFNSHKITQLMKIKWDTLSPEDIKNIYHS